MVNAKGMSNNSPIPKSDKSDSGSSEDFDFYGFTNPFVYYYAVSVLMSVSLVVSSYGIDLYNYSLQAQNWIMVGRVVGLVCLLVQALLLTMSLGEGYLRKKDLIVKKE